MESNESFDYQQFLEQTQKRAKVEPDIGTRQVALLVRQFYVALSDEGFGEDAALTLTNTWLANVLAGAVAQQFMGHEGE